MLEPILSSIIFLVVKEFVSKLRRGFNFCNANILQFESISNSCCFRMCFKLLSSAFSFPISFAIFVVVILISLNVTLPLSFFSSVVGNSCISKFAKRKRRIQTNWHYKIKITFRCVTCEWILHNSFKFLLKFV